MIKACKSILILFFVTLISCDKESHGPTRKFHMGFTTFPYAISLEAVNYTYNKIATEADIINHHFDNGVPWIEALSGLDFHSNIIDDWTFRKMHTPAGHKVYVSVSALTVERNALAKYRGSEDDMTLPEPWNSYRFNSQEVKIAYLNYCKRIITFFNPDYFNMNVEANLLYFVNPSLWSDFLEFHEFIYSELKKTYPLLTIFSSVTGAHMLAGYFDGNDHIQQRLAVMQILESSDLFAISFYPYLSKYLGDPYPEGSFDELFSLSEKPLAIAETGFPAQTFMINTNGVDLTINSDAEKQNKYISDLLQACEKHNTRFVINFVLRDYDDLWKSIGSKNDLTIAWRDTGFIDETGQERASFNTWKNYFKRPYTP